MAGESGADRGEAKPPPKNGSAGQTDPRAAASPMSPRPSSRYCSAPAAPVARPRQPPSHVTQRSAVNGTPSRTIALRTIEGGRTTSETASPTIGALGGSVVCRRAAPER